VPCLTRLGGGAQSMAETAGSRDIASLAAELSGQGTAGVIPSAVFKARWLDTQQSAQDDVDTVQLISVTFKIKYKGAYGEVRDPVVRDLAVRIARHRHRARTHLRLLPHARGESSSLSPAGGVPRCRRVHHRHCCRAQRSARRAVRVWAGNVYRDDEATQGTDWGALARQGLRLVGGHEALGNWDLQQSVLLNWDSNNVWVVRTPRTRAGLLLGSSLRVSCARCADGDSQTEPIELPVDGVYVYKYVVCEGGDAKRPSQWQSGNNQVRYPHGLKASHGAARRHHV